MIVSVSAIFVLYACTVGWDRNFLRELFPSPKYCHINLAELIQLNDSTIKPRVLVYNIENAGADAKYSRISELIKQFKITILVHTADEYQGSPRKWKYGEGVEVYHQVPLVLRTYGIFPYRTYEIPRSNVMQIPLGYMSGMIANEAQTSSDVAMESLRYKTDGRQYEWSFLGTTQNHPERHHALNVFYEWKPFVHSWGLNASAMFQIYRQSKFVLTGRGQANLDCFRIYEAMIAGSVPIVVGPEWEIVRAFEYEADYPPFLSANSFEEALDLCRKMDNATLDALREKNVLWYTNRIALTIRRIDLFMSIFPPAP